MRPVFTVDHTSNSAMADAVFSAKQCGRRASGCIFGSDLSHEFVSELGASLARATRDPIWACIGSMSFSLSGVNRRDIPRSAFRDLVAGVIGLCPKPEVVRVDAARGIARMAHAHPFRYRAIPELIRKAMSSNLFRTGHLEKSVSRRVRRSHPYPTGIGVGPFGNMRSEAFVYRGYDSGHHRAPISMVMPGAIPVAARYFAALIIPRFRTGRTDSIGI